MGDADPVWSLFTILVAIFIKNVHRCIPTNHFIHNLKLKKTYFKFNENWINIFYMFIYLCIFIEHEIKMINTDKNEACNEIIT